MVGSPAPHGAPRCRTAPAGRRRAGSAPLAPQPAPAPAGGAQPLPRGARRTGPGRLSADRGFRTGTVVPGVSPSTAFPHVSDAQGAPPQGSAPSVFAGTGTVMSITFR